MEQDSYNRLLNRFAQILSLFGTYTITIEILHGQPLNLKVSPDMAIYDVKVLMANHLRNTPEANRLYLYRQDEFQQELSDYKANDTGEGLHNNQNGNTLGDYGIYTNSRLTNFMTINVESIFGTIALPVSAETTFAEIASEFTQNVEEYRRDLSENLQISYAGRFRPNPADRIGKYQISPGDTLYIFRLRRT